MSNICILKCIPYINKRNTLHWFTILAPPSPWHGVSISGLCQLTKLLRGLRLSLKLPLWKGMDIRTSTQQQASLYICCPTLLWLIPIKPVKTHQPFNINSAAAEKTRNQSLKQMCQRKNLNNIGIRHKVNITI